MQRNCICINCKKSDFHNVYTTLKSRLDNNNLDHKTFIAHICKIVKNYIDKSACMLYSTRNYNQDSQTSYNYYKNKAMNDGTLFKLTEKQYDKLIIKPCKYCKYTGRIGIDRFDNKIGYTVKNSVPCCKYCNYTKCADDINTFKENCVLIHKSFDSGDTILKIYLA